MIIVTPAERLKLQKRRPHSAGEIGVSTPQKPDGNAYSRSSWRLGERVLVYRRPILIATKDMLFG
jgi:hypothetical protein